MTPRWDAVRALLVKELRQMRRSRGALVSTTLLPVMLMIVIPFVQLAGLLSSSSSQMTAGVPAGSTNAANAALMSRFERPLDLYAALLLPLFVAMTGVIVPAVATAYAIVAERERRSLDLLMALPVSVADVLVAKVVSVFVMALAVVVPLFAIQAAVVLAWRVADAGRVLLLLLVLLSAFVCSIGVTFIITILARDYRTANNLSGLQIAPVVVLTPICLLLLPGWAGFALLCAALSAIGLLALLVAWRWITFERYLA